MSGRHVADMLATFPTKKTNEYTHAMLGVEPEELSVQRWKSLAHTIPWECLCVDLIGPYTHKGKDNLQKDFMALTMINPTSSWFEIAELPIIERLR